MHGTARLMWALPLMGALVLAGCGGDGSPGQDQSFLNTPIGEPRSVVVKSSFIDLAERESCADEVNRLVMIDQKYVFWNRSGRCPDNGYAYRLYGETPGMPLCSQSDSIAGPRTSCTDDKVRAMFETIVKNLDQPDLGLGAAHKIEKIDFLPAKPPYKDVDVSSYSKVGTYQNKVIRDLDEWLAFWPTHSEAATPRIDFTTHMVVGIFMGMKPHGCYRTHISDISRDKGKLVVTRLERGEVAGPDIACTQAFVSPAHLVVLERSAEPVEFVVKTAQ